MSAHSILPVAAIACSHPFAYTECMMCVPLMQQKLGPMKRLQHSASACTS